MTAIGYGLGERVIASINGLGTTRAGVVTAILNSSHSGYAWNGEARYMVKFDGDHGPSGPCIAFRAEHGREDESPASGMAA